MKPNEKFKALNYTINGISSLTYCPFCDCVNDDSSEMIDHIKTAHNKKCKLRIFKDYDSNDVLHLVEIE
jgi:uncharacterized C2H2 Zn-finger protein